MCRKISVPRVIPSLYNSINFSYSKLWYEWYPRIYPGVLLLGAWNEESGVPLLNQDLSNCHWVTRVRSDRLSPVGLTSWILSNSHTKYISAPVLLLDSALVAGLYYILHRINSLVQDRAGARGCSVRSSNLGSSLDVGSKYSKNSTFPFPIHILRRYA